MIDNIIHSVIIVIHFVNNLGVSFMNIYHECKILFLYEEKMGGGLNKSIMWSLVQIREYVMVCCLFHYLL